MTVRRGPPAWVAAGGEGLPTAQDTDRDGRVWLFSCCRCGRRWANPPAPPSRCRCGSEQIVCHCFDTDDYDAIRLYGVPREWAGGEADR